MGHTYSDVLLHTVFSTKERVNYAPEKMERLRAYMGGLAKSTGAEVLSIGGITDHVHMLISAPTSMSIAKFVQLVKGSSSKWFNETFPSDYFSWQQGFSVFSVSRSQVGRVRAYVQNQEQHHAKRYFAAELIAMLRMHGIPFDPKYVLG